MGPAKVVGCVWRCGALAVLALGCRDDERLEQRVDTGTFCIGHALTEGGYCASTSLAANEPLRVSVELGCRPCATDFDYGCSVRVAGSEIIIESIWHTLIERGSGCNTACEPIVAECELPGVPPGSYRVSLGTASIHLDIPSTTVHACGGRPEARCCVDANDCGDLESCDESHQCGALPCGEAGECPVETFCDGRQCRACACPSGQSCGSLGVCGSDSAIGPAYQRCASSADCQGRREYCIGTSTAICAARCSSDADCDEPEDPSFGAACLNADGITDNFSCVIPCAPSTPSCPLQMTCHEGLFCAFAR